MIYSRHALLLGSALGLASLAAFPARADEKGDKILREAFQKLHAARSFTADLASEFKVNGQPAEPGKGRVQALKPNRLRVELTATSNGKPQKIQLISDGKSYYTYSGGVNYFRQTVKASPDGFQGNWEGEIDAFFGGAKSAEALTADYVGTERVNSVLCDLIKAKAKNAQTGSGVTYAIGQKDKLIYRSANQMNAQVLITNTLSNIRLGADIAPTQFAFVPPKGAKMYDPDAEMRQMEAKLVAPGQDAPAFEATDPVTNSRFSLADALDKKKAVLVNFWFYG